MKPESEKKLADKLERIAMQLMAIVEDLRAYEEVIPLDIANRFDAFERAGLCLNCGKPLGSEPVTRGCHRTCYAVLKQRIARGQGNEWDYVREGRMRPAGKGGRKTEPLPPLPPTTGDPVVDKALEAGMNTARTVQRGRQKPPEEKKPSTREKRTQT